MICLIHRGHYVVKRHDHATQHALHHTLCFPTCHFTLTLISIYNLMHVETRQHWNLSAAEPSPGACSTFLQPYLRPDALGFPLQLSCLFPVNGYLLFSGFYFNACTHAMPFIVYLRLAHVLEGIFTFLYLQARMCLHTRIDLGLIGLRFSSRYRWLSGR
jgi:hypothetical protein